MHRGGGGKLIKTTNLVRADVTKSHPSALNVIRFWAQKVNKKLKKDSGLKISGFINLTSFSLMSKKGEVEAKRANHKNKKLQNSCNVKLKHIFYIE